MVLWVMAALGVLALLGVWLLVVGLRGRRIDDHPVCRACGFDLAGEYRLERCPECGAPVGGAMGVRVGRRRMRPAVVAGGLLLLGVAIGSGGTIGWLTYRNFDWNRAKPLWLLRREAMGPAAGAAGIAVREVNRRIADGRVSRGAAAPLIAAALDGRFATADACSTLVNGARSAGLLTSEELERHFRRIIRVETIRYPERVREGQPMPVRASVQWGPLGSNTPAFCIVLRTIKVEIDGRVIEAEDPDGRGFLASQSVGAYSPSGYLAPWYPFAVPLGAPEGEHAASVRVIVELYEADTAGAPLLTISKESRGSVRVVGSQEEVVRLVTDAELKSVVEAALQPGRARAGMSADGTRLLPPTFGDFHSSPPVQVVARVHARIGDRDYRLGATVVRGPWPGWGAVAMGPADVLPSPVPTLLDFVLRPDPVLAEELGFDAIWGEEIVAHDVVVIIRSGLGPVEPVQPPLGGQP